MLLAITLSLSWHNYFDFIVSLSLSSLLGLYSNKNNMSGDNFNAVKFGYTHLLHYILKWSHMIVYKLIVLRIYNWFQFTLLSYYLLLFTIYLNAIPYIELHKHFCQWTRRDKTCIRCTWCTWFLYCDWTELRELFQTLWMK